jgi:pyruvate kinase
VKRTKIVATLGPASDTPELVAQLIAAGVNVVRMNFSHGSHPDHARRIAMVRRAAAAQSRGVAVLLDLQGPKIRTGKLAGGVPVELLAGREFVITHRDVPGDASCVSTSYEALASDVRPGDRILLSDGLIELRVLESSGSEVKTSVVNGGLLKERQGINLPGVSVSSPGVTEKDVEDLRFGLAEGVDYVAISFVRSANDVRQVQRMIAEQGFDTPVIAKIEKPEALEALSEILDAADGVMVARGDLGVELDPEKVPLAQKQIIREANLRAKPVITATQMLESMIENPRPTRAEASDVANAILDGSDAVMLSGETAVGRHPVEAVSTMLRIAHELESDPTAAGVLELRQSLRTSAIESGPEAIGGAVASVAANLDSVSAVWVFTQSGSTARIVSRRRLDIPIIAFTPNEQTYQRMALLWGVIPFLTGPAHDLEQLEAGVMPLAVAAGFAKRGDTIVVTGSHPFDAAAPTNFLKIQCLD